MSVEIEDKLVIEIVTIRCRMCEEDLDPKRFYYHPARQTYNKDCRLCYNRFRRAKQYAEERGNKLTLRRYLQLLTQQRAAEEASKEELDDEQVQARKTWF